MTEQFRKPVSHKKTKKLTKKQKRQIIESYRAVPVIVDRSTRYHTYERRAADELIDSADW